MTIFSTSSISPATSSTPSRNSSFLPLIHKDFSHESGFFASTDHRAFAVVAVKLELRVFLEVRNTRAHIGTRTRLQHVALWNGMLRYHAGLHRPVKTVGLVGCRVVVVLWCVACELPTASLTSQARVYCGYRPGPTRVIPPQAGWWRYQSASSCVRACGRVLHCARSRVCGRWLCCLTPALLLERRRLRCRSISVNLGTAPSRSTTLSLSSQQAHPPSACATSWAR